MLLKLTIFGVALLAALSVLIWSQQRLLVYAPDPNRIAPGQAGLDRVREILLEAPDGTRLVAWYGAPRPLQPTLLYFHGNAGNLATRAGRMAHYLDAGRGMLMLSYRGYGGSGGRPSEADNVADAGLAYRWLNAQGIEAADIIVYGESLGSGVAVQLAERVPLGGVILDAPYTSVADVGRRLYPLLPVDTFLIDRYDSLARIERIGAPLLIVHGAEDKLIPIAMGRQLYDRARPPKQFAAIEGAGHADHHLYGSYPVIDAWIDGLRRGDQR